MKRNTLLMAAFVAGLFTITSCNNNPSNDSKKEADQVNKEVNAIAPEDSKFMTEAASGGMMEVKAGQIATERGISKEVKAFGQKMIEEHSKANAELKDLAAKKNVTLPDSLSNDDQKKIDKLNKADAKDFDKTYMDMMVDDHKSDVDAFQKKVDNPKDADVKAWADKTLPTLIHHLDLAKTDKDIVDKIHKDRK
jgi:putative membrane protein